MGDDLPTRVEELLSEAVEEQLKEQRALREVADSLTGVATAMEDILAERLGGLHEAIAGVEARLGQLEERVARLTGERGLLAEPGPSFADWVPVAPERPEEAAPDGPPGRKADRPRPSEPPRPGGRSGGEESPVPDILSHPPQERPIPDGGRLRSRRRKGR